MGRGRTSGVGRKGRLASVLSGFAETERQAVEQLEKAGREAEESAARMASARRVADAIADVRGLQMRYFEARRKPGVDGEKLKADFMRSLNPALRAHNLTPAELADLKRRLFPE
jgi:hypothetical protein